MAKWFFATALLMLTALGAMPCRAQPVLVVDTAPALSRWTAVEFAAYTRATGIKIQGTTSAADADILIAPAPFPQVAEHGKLTLPYIAQAATDIPAGLKDDDGDWTALAITALAFTTAPTPPDATAANALRLLLIHTKFPLPPGTPALLSTLAPRQDVAISFPANPSGGRLTIVVPYFIARLKAGQQPAAAAALIDFLLAKPAQSRLPALAWAMPARSDVPPADAHAKLVNKLLEDVAIYTPNWHQARKTLTG